MASMLSLKVAAISTGVVSAAVILKLCIAPLISDLIVSNSPSLYTIIQSFLRPLYLYLLINGIIISIVASSKLQSKSPSRTQTSHSGYNSFADVAVPARIPENGYIGTISKDKCGYSYENNATIAAERISIPATPIPPRIRVDAATVVADRQILMDGGGSSEARPVRDLDLDRIDSMDLVNLLSQIEKPPVSRRFAQRKTAKATPPHHHSEGKALGVTKPKRHDTLESTWKTITEGRHVPLTRHLKKSDTWERVQKEQHVRAPPPLPNKMKKSDTFSDCKTTATKAVARNNQRPLARSSGSGKLKKDPSLSQDELNRRVEAFITKFNADMRLQRLESLNQYNEMIKRGAH